MGGSAAVVAATFVWFTGTVVVIWTGIRAVRNGQDLRILGVLGLALVGLLAPTEVGLAMAMRGYLPAGAAGRVVTDWAAIHQWIGLGALVLGGVVLFFYLRTARSQISRTLMALGLVPAVAGLATLNLL